MSEAQNPTHDSLPEVSSPSDLKPISDLKSLQKISRGILDSNSPLDYIKESGIDLLAIYKNLERIALHSKIIGVLKGELEELGPNDKAQIAASQLILELAKHIDKSAKGDTNFTFNLTVEQRNEIKERMERIFGRNGG